MKVIISTVGTSMLNTFRRDPELGPIIQTLQECRPEQLNEYKEEYERLYRELVRTGTAESFDPVTFSAETNSLFRMQVKKGDRVEFLVSDTLDGLVCGKALDRICAARWELEAECRVIDGLQVKDSKEFRRTGLNTLVDTLESILNRYDPRAYEVIVNPTGGFKAVVPYLTLFGLIHAIPVRYIYERSDSLIELPSAPLSLNVDILCTSCRRISLTFSSSKRSCVL
jgi:putative CRISPR-associated protein (TIGR02619 family)